MPRTRLLVAVLAAGMVLAGCFTGERPSFSDDPFVPGTPTGDAAIDTLLAELEGGSPPFTAAYDVLLKFGATTNTAIVAINGADRSVTVRDVRYLTTTGATRTCRTVGATASCTDGVNAAPISDTGVLTPDFTTSDAARRIRRDAAATIAPTVSRVDEVAGQAVTCVDLSLAGGTTSYCVLDSGVLGVLDDGDVRVTLTAYSTTVDPTLFVDLIT